MSERSGFFPDVSGDREYTTDFLAKWVASFIGNGVYDGTLAVTAGSNMQIKIPSGQAWINGYYYRNDGDMAFNIANANGVLNRKDTVVLRWDINTRNITAQILVGTPASTAIAPAIVRTAEQYDLKLAEISIPAGTTAIKQSLITDTRLDNNVCGIVTGVIDQVKTTTFYNQIADDLAEFKTTNEAGFTAWLNGIKDVLGADAAGNLLNLINTHIADTAAHVTVLSYYNKTGTAHILTGLTAVSGKVACMFEARNNYTAGDTFTIDGTAYGIYGSGGQALRTNAFLAGNMVFVMLDIDRHIIHFNMPSTFQIGALPNTVTALKNPYALTIAYGYAGGSGRYDGSFANTIAVPYFVFSTSAPTSTLHAGEIWGVY